MKGWLSSSIDEMKKELFKRDPPQKLKVHKYLIGPQHIKVPLTDLLQRNTLTVLNTASKPTYTPETLLKYHPIKNLETKKKSGFSSTYRRDPIQRNKLKQRQLIFGKLGMFS